jgi:DNA polymerase III delta prime subunit
MPVAPLHQREEGNAEFAPLCRESILEALGTLAVADAVEDALGHETVQAVREHVAGNAEACLQLIEAVAAEDDVANDEQRPPVTDHLQRPGDRADLPLVAAL